MARFTLPRDIYYGKGTLETLKTLKGKRAIIVVGGGSMKRFGFLDKRWITSKKLAWKFSCLKMSSPIPRSRRS